MVEKMKKVKIYGAGSIGNHLANASRQLGWEVSIVDVDAKALDRTCNDIYPSRYGKWDESIKLYLSEDEPKGGFDYIFVGTPPESHIPLGLSALNENPSAILIEKPFCTPSMSDAQKFFEEAVKKEIKIFTGYDHVVGAASSHVSDLIKQKKIGEILTLDVEFREHWEGIFNAHPWLNGPADSYLGYWNQGGGSCGEHSHATNLWQFFANCASMGRISEVSATLNYVKSGTALYDDLCSINVRTEKGLCGRIIQDVITRPPKKFARIQGSCGYIEWHCGKKPGIDSVIHETYNGSKYEKLFKKTRPDDFITELKHIDEHTFGLGKKSPISIEEGLGTMLIVAAAHKSSSKNQTVKINYEKGFSLDSLD